jgi:hypothetical protein
VRLLVAFLLCAFTLGCGGKPAPPAAKPDTTAACCDSATLAKCRADSSGCGECPTPAAPADTATGTATPCSSGGCGR